MSEIYSNKKNGGLYEKLAVVVDATNSRSGQFSVLYRPLGVDNPVMYVRELEEFNEKFDLIEEVESEMATAVMVVSSKL